VTLVALVDDARSERETDAMILRRQGFEVVELDPSPPNAAATAAAIMQTGCEIAVVDRQLDLVPGVIYAGEAVLEFLRQRAAHLMGILWSKQRKIEDELPVRGTEGFMVIPKEVGATQLGNTLRQALTQQLNAETYTTVVVVVDNDRSRGRLIVRALGLSEEPIEATMPAHGLAPELFGKERSFRARVQIVGGKARIFAAEPITAATPATLIRKLELTCSPKTEPL